MYFPVSLGVSMKSIKEIQTHKATRTKFYIHIFYMICLDFYHILSNKPYLVLNVEILGGLRTKCWQINCGQLPKTVVVELPTDLNVCASYQSVPQSPQWTHGPKDSLKAVLRPPLSTKTELIRKLIASPEAMGLQTLSYAPCWGNIAAQWCTVINST